MKCPDCNNLLNEKQVIDKPYRIDIDKCVNCGGLWFDGNKLEEYRASTLSTSEYTILPEFDLIPGRDPAVCCRCEQNTLAHYNVGVHILRRCLNCSGTLVEKNQILELVRKPPEDTGNQVFLSLFELIAFLIGMTR